MKVHPSDPSKDRSFKTVRQLEQVFEPYRKMFRKLNEGKDSSSHHDDSTKKRKTVKTIRDFSTEVGGKGGGKLFIDFCFFAGLVLEPNPR
jgi:hypothetical protein